MNGAPFVYRGDVLMPCAGAREEALVEYGFACLDAFGIAWGPAHIELKQTPRGPVVTSYELQVTSYELRVTSHESRVTSYELRVTSHESRVTSYKLRASLDRSASSRSRRRTCTWSTCLRTRYSRDAAEIQREIQPRYSAR